jgi:PleD family two-component response regulator
VEGGATQDERRSPRLVAIVGERQFVRTPSGVVTASFGLGVFRGPKDPGELFTSVDAALYRAKDGGRNAVCLADL